MSLMRLCRRSMMSDCAISSSSFHLMNNLSRKLQTSNVGSYEQFLDARETILCISDLTSYAFHPENQSMSWSIVVVYDFLRLVRLATKEINAISENVKFDGKIHKIKVSYNQTYFNKLIPRNRFFCAMFILEKVFCNLEV